MVAPTFSSAPSAAPTRAAPRPPQGVPASPKPSFEGKSGRSFVSSVTTTTLVTRSAAPSAGRAVNSGGSVNLRPAQLDGSGTVTTETRHVKLYSRQLPQENVKTTQRSAAVENVKTTQRSAAVAAQETVKATQRSVAVAAHASRKTVEASASCPSIVVRGAGCQDDCSEASAKYKCPSCGAFLPTLEEATHHCQKWGNKCKVIYHHAPCAAEEASRQHSGVDTPTTRCSDGGSLESSSVAPPIVAHPCSPKAKLGAVDPQGARPDTAVVPTSEIKAEAFTELPSGEPISYDAVGQPIIVRQSNDETGEARTFVKNVHGAISIFGTSTISSLVSNQESAAGEFVDNLTDRELRGLVHELGRRVLHKSEQYQVQKEAWDSLADRANYAYFDLPDDGATEKDLEMAYRRLAKRMHPDKNGGGDEAKKRFQDMKERYEALKSRWHADDGPQGEGKAAGQRAGNSDGSPARHEAYDEDEDIPADPEESGSIEYDPTDRASLKKTVFQMLKHFRSLERGLKQVITELGRQTGMQTHATVG